MKNDNTRSAVGVSSNDPDNIKHNPICFCLIYTMNNILIALFSTIHFASDIHIADISSNCNALLLFYSHELFDHEQYCTLVCNNS